MEHSNIIYSLHGGSKELFSEEFPNMSKALRDLFIHKLKLKLLDGQKDSTGPRAIG